MSGNPLYFNYKYMSRKFLLMLLLCVPCSIHTIAQTDYYYYQGNKIPLTLNENKVVVSIPKECGNTIESIRANVQVMGTIKDEAFDIIVTTQSDFDKLTSMDFWEESAKSVIITSGYYTENNDEVFTTPYLNVRLKKEEDADILTSYMEKYKLKIVRNMPSMPLWYILSLTSDSEEGPLVCANELYESGAFASSVPDFASVNLQDPTTARAITFSVAGKTYDHFDLQGRRITGQPTKGVYIQDGRKVLVK